MSGDSDECSCTTTCDYRVFHTKPCSCDCPVHRPKDSTVHRRHFLFGLGTVAGVLAFPARAQAKIRQALLPGYRGGYVKGY